MDSPGLTVPVNETDHILAEIITSNSPEDQLILEFLTNAEVEGGKAPAPFRNIPSVDTRHSHRVHFAKQAHCN